MSRFLVACGLLVLVGCRVPAEPTGPAAVLAAGKSEVSLLFVGDTSVARGIGTVIDDANDPARPFARMRETLDAHDLVFANLECVLSDSSSEEANKTYRIRAPEKNGSALHDVGIDVVSVANNHAMDFGLQGLTHTLAALEKEGVVAVGAQRERGWAQPVTIMQVGVFSVGFLAYNAHGDEYEHESYRPTAARYDIDDVIDDIRRARPRVDFLVVSVHGGVELSHELAPWQERDAKAAIDAGADLWIGHHPHVVQPWTVYRGKVIAWSLGDFVFDKEPQWLIARNSPRFFLQLNLRKDAEGKIVADPTLLGGAQDGSTWQPMLAPGSFDVDSFEQRSPPPTLRDLLPAARVERVRGDIVTLCDRWETRRIPLGVHAFRWLAPRFACADADAEKLRPWETVAKSAELFEGALKYGIWAHPNSNGVLRLRFTNVELGSRLEGFAGFPDWQIALRDKARKRHKDEPSAATVRVLVAQERGAGLKLSTWIHGPSIADVPQVVGGLDGVTTVPCKPGTTPLRLDTSDLQGTRHDVVVEISGGSGDVEGRFLFDLAVVP